MNFSKNGKISGNNNKSKSNLRPTLIANQNEIKKEEITIVEEIIVIDKDKTDTEFWEDCEIVNLKKNENKSKNKIVEKTSSEEYLTCKNF